MLHKLDKKKYFKKAGFLVVILSLLFFNTTPSYAQYRVYGGYVSQGTDNDNFTQPTITTTNATNVTPTTATLNALMNGSSVYNTYNLSTWFDYGTTVNLGISSSGYSANFGYASFISNISGLTPNTVYYFRAMAQSSKGITYGGINSFRTTIPPIPTVNTNNTNTFNTVNTYTPPTPPKATITKTPATSKSEVTVKEVKDQKQNTNTSANSFLPITILGWILLIILILILILTIKHLHLKFTDKK